MYALCLFPTYLLLSVCNLLFIFTHYHKKGKKGSFDANAAKLYTNVNKSFLDGRLRIVGSFIVRESR